jgi:exopolysaccharide biosynthesis polyprenyl glycosylphosphotransferase
LLSQRNPDRVQPRQSQSRRPATRWETRYRAKLALIDATAGVLGAVAGYLVRPGTDRAVWCSTEYTTVALLAPLVWAVLLAAVQSRAPRPLGDGRTDLRDLVVGAAIVLAGVAWLTWATPIQVPRDFSLLTLAAAAGASLAGRGLLRLDLRRRRIRGQCQQLVLAVGRGPETAALATQLRRDKHHSARVVGCCVPASPDDPPPALDGIPVISGFDDVVGAMQMVGADTVAVLPCPELNPIDLRRLAWAIENHATRFVMIPGLVDVAGPRLAVGPVGELPVLHVRHARLSGPGWLVKGLVDRLLALLALLLLAPVLSAIAILIRFNSPGPALFRQTRVGVHGREFTLLKFRTMHVGAERLRAELSGTNINQDGLLFKVPDDPRITSLGAMLRRWSLDELPQLLNVLAGTMSLVGPRPPLPEEVARYGTYVSRRLAVRPGLTGLWQISGRSDLSWDEAVRLDLQYVDNWSLGLDAVVLWRTLPAVLHHTGAY